MRQKLISPIPFALSIIIIKNTLMILIPRFQVELPYNPARTIKIGGNIRNKKENYIALLSSGGVQLGALASKQYRLLSSRNYSIKSLTI